MTLCYNCFKEKTEGKEPCPHCGFDLSENVKKYPVALRAGTLLNGRYLIGRVLGQGGFGITYLAWDTQLEAKVAVKEYMPGELAGRIDGTSVLSPDFFRGHGGRSAGNFPFPARLLYHIPKQELRHGRTADVPVTNKHDFYHFLSPSVRLTAFRNAVNRKISL